MTRRNDPSHRCARCRMHAGLCVCPLIPRLVTRTRLLLVMHRFEDFKTTNTGRLATQCLVNSDIVVRGDAALGNPPIELDSATEPLFLFPAADALGLEALAPTLRRPVTLIVPDGSWRQAGRVRSRVPGLRELPCVTFATGAPSTYRLRAEREPSHLSTLEAIARAFEILEGPEVRRAIERPFHAMVDRMLWVRGALAAEAVSDGIPDGARRHEPRSGATARAPARES